MSRFNLDIEGVGRRVRKNVWGNIRKKGMAILLVLPVITLVFSTDIPQAQAATVTQVYASPTTGDTFVVPAGVTSITVKAWGAGGGGGRGGAAGRVGGSGGGGGFSQATIPVTPGNTLIIQVGSGGSRSVTSGYPGAGGGYSGVFLTSATGTNALIVAGAGGGGGGSETSGTGGNGGVGGGSTGGAGGNGAATYGGAGGTQSVGGAKAATGITEGSSLQGGIGGPTASGVAGGLPGGGTAAGDNGHGGGGGGGYYGGGGGGGAGLTLGGGGGGGSNYVTYTGSSATTSTQAVGSTTANGGDPDYVAGVGSGGIGGTNANGADGGIGRVVISYAGLNTVFTISGTVYSDNGTTPVGAGAIVNVKVGNYATTSATTASNGTYTISAPTSTASTPITLFVNGSSTMKATTFLMGVDGVSNVTGIPLYKDTFISMSTTSAGVVDMKQMTFFDAEDDGDVLYSAYGSSTLATSSPATTTIHGNFLVATGTTYAPTNLAINGNFTNNGAFKHNSGNIDISGAPLSQGGFDLVTTAFDSLFSVAGQETNPNEIAFNSDGTKMFLIGSTGDDITEYNLSVGFDISTAAVSGTLFSVAAQDTVPSGLTFNSDGTKMFVVGSANDKVYSYDLLQGFNIATASSTGSTSVAAQDTNPQVVTFNPDGTKMFVSGQVNSGVYAYSLSTGFAITTAVYSKTLSVAAQDTSPQGVAFNSDGTKMFMAGNSADAIYEYQLATAFDISTASYIGTFSTAAQDAQTTGVTFKPDGTKMFVVGGTAFKISEYHLAAPFDLAATSSGSFSVAIDDTNPTDVTFNTDGSKMFVVGTTNDSVVEYRLTTPYDVATAASTTVFSVAAQEINPQGIAFNATGSKMYVIGSSGDDVNEYTLSTPFDISSASYRTVFSIAAEDNNPTDVTFNRDGTKMYVLGGTGVLVYEYPLSVGFDVSTASYSNDDYNVSSEETNPTGVEFNTDGSKMFIVGSTGDDVNEYYLATLFDVRTAVFVDVFSIALQEITASGLTFNSNGAKMYLIGTTNDRVYQYELGEKFGDATSTLSGTMTGTSAFNNVTFSGDSTKIISANASTSDFTTNLGAIVSAPSKLTVGNFTNDGTFTHNNGTVYLAGTSTNISGKLDVTSAFSDTVIDTGLIFKNDGVTWNGYTAAAANSWYAVAFGSSTYVAVSVDGGSRVMTSPDGMNWTSRSASAANQWTSVIYAEGLFVAVSYTGTDRVMTSPDGITWTPRVTPGTGAWDQVAYGNGFFVAVGSGGTNRVMTSPDGITWTMRTAAAQNGWDAVTYGEGLFVAVAIDGGNRVMTSPDGITWTGRLAAAQNEWYGVTYGNGQFVALASTSATTSTIMTSPDGIAWTARSVPLAQQWWSITYGDGLFVAVANNGTNRVMTSRNGIDWTMQTATEVTQWRNVVYANNGFIAVGNLGTNRVMMSTSGSFVNDTVTFLDTASTTDLTINTNSTFVAPDTLYVGDDYINNGTFTHGSGTTYFTGASASVSGTMTGTSAFHDVTVDGGGFRNNGVTWTAASSSEANDWLSVTYGNGTFVAVSATGTSRVMTSPDGITWTARTAAQTNDWLSVTYGNDLFVAVAINGTNRVMTSPDGITWKARSATQTNRWNSVTYGNGTFVAVADTGTNRVMNSSDGFTWSVATSSEQNTWGSVTYGNGLFVAVADSGVIGSVMTSPDGITWTTRTVPQSMGWTDVTYGNGQFVAVTNSGTGLMTSPDGITWTSRSIPEVNAWNSVTYGNDLFVAVAENGTNRVMTSPDGITWTARSAAQTNRWNSVTYGNGTFVAVADTGTNRVMRSSSGATTTGTFAFSNNASTTDFEITNSDTVTAPTLLSVAGNYTNDGTFTNNSGTVYFSGTTTEIGDGFDIPTATFSDSANVASQEATLTGVAFNASGTRMYTTGSAGDKVYMYSLANAFSLSSTTFLASTSVSAQDTAPQSITFNTNGTKMYVTGGTGQDINEYTLSTAWDVTTATFSFVFSVAAQDTAPRGIAFNGDGTKMYVTGQTGSDLSVYDLSTPFTASTSVYSSSFPLTRMVPTDVAFNADGTKMFAIGVTRSEVTAYTLSTPYDVSASSIATSTIISVGASASSTQAFAFNPDGTKMFVVSSTSVSVQEYTLLYDQTITGTLTGTSAFNNVTLVGDSTKTFASNASTSAFTISTNATVVAPPDSLSISGNYTNSGTFDAGEGTTTFNGASAQGLSGTLTGTSTFNHVEFTGAGTKTFSSNASTSNLIIQSGTTVVAPTSLTIGGDYTNNGTFTKGSNTLHVKRNGTSLGGFSLATTTFRQSFSMAAQDTIPEDIFFNTNGTKMFMVGNQGDDVNEYNLSTPYDATTAIFDSNFPVQAGTASWGLSFNTDGTRMFVLSGTADEIQEYHLSTGFDVSTATYDSNLLVGSQDATPAGLAFNTNGTKLFMIGTANNSVYEYNLGTAFDVSTAVYDSSFSFASFESSPDDIDFSTDGTRMFIIGYSGDKVYTFRLQSAFDISTAVYSGAFSVATQDTDPSGIFFKPDGTKLFVIGIINDSVYEYNMAAPYDFGATTTSSFSVLAQEAQPVGLTFSPDGSKMFVIGWTGDRVFQYHLSDPFNVSTALYNSSSSVLAQDTFPEDVAFNPDGTRMLVLGSSVPDRIFQYNLSTGFNVSTAVFQASTSITAQETGPSGFTFNIDGTKMFVIGNAGDEVNAYNLSTGFDITTAVVTGSPFSVAGQDTSPEAITFNQDGTRMFMTGSTGARVYEYRLSTGYDIATAVFQKSLSVTAQDAAPVEVDFSTDGTTMFVIGHNSDSVYEYNIAEFFDNGTSTLAGTMTGTSAFNNVSFSGNSTTTFSSNASTTNFSIATGTRVIAPTLLSISGSYTNNGGFEAGVGTTSFDGTSVQTATGTMTGNDAFYNLDIRNSSATTTLGATTTVDNNFTSVASARIAFPANATTTIGTLTLNGGVGGEIRLRSTTYGTQWNLNVTTNNGVSYVNVRDSNACGGITISATHSTDSTNNTCWSIGEDPILASLDNQYFTVGQATTSISTISVLDSGNPVITAANDIRIAIATSTHNMKFDTFDTSAVMGGSAASKVSATVSYTGNGSVLIIDVTENFVGDDELLISGLSFAQFLAIAPEARVLNLYYDGPADTIADATDLQTIAITGALAVSNHDAGQATNAFTFQNQTATPLFRFKMAPTNESSAIGALTLNLTAVRRINNSNLQNIALYRDFNADGVVNGNDLAIGGTGVISTGEQTGTIVFSTSFLATTSQNYIVVGDTVSIKPNEHMTVSLLVQGSVTGSTSLAGIVPTGSVNSVQHERGAGAGSGGGAGAVGGEAPAGAGIVGGGGDGGGQSIGGEPGFAPPTAQGSPFTEWTSGVSGLVSDNVYATAASINLRQSYSVFGFSVPPGNQVDGIEVKLESSGTTAAGTIQVGLSWNGDTTITAVKATSVLTGSDAVYTLGGPADTWGRSWTPAELGDANFFVRVIGQPNSNTVRVDAIQVKPYHSATGGGAGGGGEI